MANTAAPKNDQRIVFGVVIAIIIILVIAIFWSGREANVFLPDNGEVDIETREPMDPAEGWSFDLIHPKSWDRSENASEDILVLGEDQAIASFIVPDPQDDNIFYFITNYESRVQFRLRNPTLNSLSVYRYAYDDYSFERIYRQEIADGLFMNDSNTPTDFMAVGIEDNNLLLLARPYGTEFKPFCPPALSGQGESRGLMSNLVAINLDDPYQGLTEYTLSTELQEELESQCDEEDSEINLIP